MSDHAGRTLLNDSETPELNQGMVMKNTRLATSSLLIGTLLLSTSALSFGTLAIDGAGSTLLNNKNKENQQWNGIGQIFWGDNANCTASLLDTRDQNNNAVGPAYVLTAGNCVSGIPHLLQPQPISRTVTFNYFSDTNLDFKSYTIRTTTWENRDNTDLAIIELQVPLSTLLEDGITPLKLVPQSTDALNNVLVFGTRTSTQNTGLRVQACTQESTGGAVLAGVDELYLNTLKNSCGAADYSSSGAPVVDRDSGTLLSVLSMDTYNSTSERQCFDFAPCEVKDGQPVWTPQTRYGHSVSFLSSCFSDGVFTNTSNACTLGRSFEVTDLDNYSRYTAMPFEDKPLTARATFSLNTPYYRFKATRDPAHCGLPVGYSNIEDATDATIKSPIPRETGLYFLCVTGVDTAEQALTTEHLKGTLILPTQLIERTLVALPLNPNYRIYNDGSLALQFSQNLPANLAIRYYKGPFKETDCSNVDKKDYVHTSYEAPINTKDFPFTMCVKNVDLSHRVSKNALTFHFNKEGRMSR
ncbi:trypsin-like serine protease [Pseudomonas sp. GB2N2]